MRIALATVGTTGDVRPFAALARVLADAGHAVTAVSWELHRASFEAVGATFVGAGPATSWDDIRGTATEAADRGPMDQVAVLRDFHLRDAAEHYRQLGSALPGHDLVVLHGIHSLAEAAARDAGLRWATAVFDPVLLPTATAAPAGMPPLGPFNRVGWWLLDRMLGRLDPPLHAALTEAGSPSAGRLSMFRARSPLLHLVACSPSIARVPGDLPPTTHFTGAWVDPTPPPALDPELEAFLAAGPPPVAICFGSTSTDPARIAPLVAEAARIAGRRTVIQLGTGGLPPSASDPAVRYLGAVDHRALFPRMAVVVHHAGAGTTHTAAAAGIPQVTVPHVGDQLYWADRVRRLGAGPAPLPYRRLEATALGRLIRNAADQDYAPAVRRLSVAIREDDGTGAALDLLMAAARA